MTGLQSWIALPKMFEETNPAFFHHAGASLPELSDTGIKVRVIAGNAYGETSPVQVFSGTLYVDAMLEAGAILPLPRDHEERSVYILEGSVEIAGEEFSEGRLLIFRPGDAISIRAVTPARFVIVGGEPMDGERHIWWNFVSSSKERIEQAKADWKAGKFGTVPGDDREFIPLPE
jgi:redox-sensitive bicupin YhaK (pirin superfamily)